jgi:sugar phosphate isomerase/epimerase
MRAALMDAVVDGYGDVFAVADRFGFSGVELSLRRAELRSGGLESIRARARGRKVEIHALVLGEHNHGGIADADSQVAGAAFEDVRTAIAWAAELGAGVILVPFFMRGEIEDDAGFARCVRAFTSLCPVAADHGVTLCFEGLLPAREIRLLAERVASPAFGCYFDLANPLRRGLDSPTELRVLGELVKRVHVKDLRVAPGDVHPGLGLVDFGECARALDEIGYDGWITLETPPGPPPLVGRDLSFTYSTFPAIERGRAWPRFGAFSYELVSAEWEALVSELVRLRLDSVVVGRELLAECLDRPDVAESRRSRLEDAGIEVAALAGYRNLIAPDPTVRAENIEHLGRCLELAPELGTWIVATETGTRHAGGDWTDTPENWGAEAWRLLDDAIEQLLPIAESSGTILALEGSVKNVLRTQSQLRGLLDRFPTQHLQVVSDPYNFLSAHVIPAEARSTREFLTRFEDRFVLAHLKDVDAGGAEVATPEFGSGVFEQRPYLEFLRDRRPDLDLIVEHLTLEQVPTVLERVGRLIGGESPASVASR